MAKSILYDWRIILMIILVVVAFLAIQPNITGVNGAQVIYMPANSYIGNLSARGVIGLSTGSIITAVNGIPVHNIQQFYAQLNKSVVTNGTLSLTYKDKVFPYIYTSNTSKIFVEPNAVFNSSTIETQNVPYTNLNYGLDIIGGTQIEIVPNATNYNSTLVTTLETTLSKRLDVYGISGTTVSTVQALSGKSFIMVSMPSVGQSQALSLIQNQGKFYATIGNFTVFNSSNSSESILDVCLSSGCPFGVYQTPSASNGYQFQFGIQMASGAAKNFENAVKSLSPSTTNPGYFNKKIYLYLNGVEQGQPLLISTNILTNFNGAITIEGSGSDQQQATLDMKTLMAIMQSGSLPVPLKIVSINSVSSTAGGQFISQIYLLLVIAFILISIVIFMRYRDYKISSMILITSLTEIFIVIGIAAAIHWTLDIPSMAGIIASIGISVDDQIIITDEMRRGAAQAEYTVTKKRISRAFFIIFVSFFSFAAIMFPLLFSTASLFAGFALTTILASLVGLLVTRPAYARIIARLEG
jgi:preprotein translocase subunit SecD